MTEEFICSNLSLGENGNLFFAGQDTVELARRYGTPLYLMDEERIRSNCRRYVQAVAKAFHGRGRVLFASKAAAFKRMYAILAEEGMYADVVSPGEIWTAARAGFPLEHAWFHSSNKSDEDLAFALEQGVGVIVVDSEEELLALDRIAGERGRRQPILGGLEVRLWNRDGPCRAGAAAGAGARACRAARLPQPCRFAGL